MKGPRGIGPVAAVLMALAVAACVPAEPLVGEPPSLTAPAPDTELGKLLWSPEVTVAGQKLNGDRLRRFYARHGFQPVWTARPADAELLLEAVYRAGDHGLAPELFHAPLLRASARLSTLERDLLLSDAFLAYADALARGAHPVERRRNDETLTPGPIDIAAVLNAALARPDPPAAIEALAPTTPTYRLLRQALRDLRGGSPTNDTANTGTSTGLRQSIVVNLERERWLPRRLPADRVWVNVTDQRLTMYRDDRPAFSSRVIIGQAETRNQTPELQVPIDAIWFNPPWTIPADIAEKSYLPKAKADPDYLARNNLVMLPDGVLQQRMGPYSGLGSLLFDMNNRFDVYLHDTPSKDLFRRDDRRISHGCIRVEDPRKLAALVMQLSPEDIDQRIATGVTVRTPVAKPVPVFVVYQTAFADSDGKLQFRADIYGRDAAIWQSLAPQRQVVAQR